MFFLSDVNSIEFGEKRSKVKSYVRKGRIVRQHDRKVDIKSALLGGGIGALGVGALTGAYLLGKGKVKPQQVIQQATVNADDIANKIISKLPKQQVVQPNVNINTDDIVTKVVSKIKLPQQQNIDVDDVVNKVVSRIPQPQQQSIDIDQLAKEVSKQIKVPNQSIDYDEIAKRVNVVTPSQQQQVNTIADNINDNVVNVEITKIKLPQKINSLSKQTVNRLTQQASTMTDDVLEKEINKYAKQFKKSTKTQQDINNGKILEGYITKYKSATKKTERNYLKKQIDEILDYFKLPKDNIENTRYNFNIDDDYVSKLNKLRTRNKNILDIYQNELFKRRSLNQQVITPNDDSINRLGSFLEDFSAANQLIEFCNYIRNAPLFFISDYDNSNYGRKLRSKDKKTQT